MSIFKNETTEAIYEHFDSIVYPSQFMGIKNGPTKLRSHIIQAVKGCNGNKVLLTTMLNRYNVDCDVKELINGYNNKLKSVCNYNYFTKVLEDLEPEAFEYFHNRRRFITLFEYKFVLNKISSAIYKKLKNLEKSDISYAYFLKKEYKSGGDTLRDTYEKECHRSISKRKLTHIFKYLEYLHLIHREHNKYNSYTYYIGPANPLYFHSIVPDVDELKFREINFIGKKEKELENGNMALKAENDQIPALKAALFTAWEAALQPSMEKAYTTEAEPQDLGQELSNADKLQQVRNKEVIEQAAQAEQEMLDQLPTTEPNNLFENMGLKLVRGKLRDVSTRKERYGKIPADYFPQEATG